ncbi:hypothetical protein ACF0H5_007738 [Mactra antiquata]
MDQFIDLFNNGNCKTLYKQLINQQKAQSSNKLADQLLLSNNIAVCQVLMSETSSQSCHGDYEFIDILKKCYSIPAREESLYVELTVLYNYVYNELITKKHENSSYCYSLIYKTCQKVLMCGKIGHKVKQSDILLYEDMKTAAWTTIQKCLNMLQLYAAEPILFEVFLQLVILLCVIEMMNSNSEIVKPCLCDINKMFSHKDFKVNTSRHDILSLCLPLYIDQVQLTLRSSDGIKDVFTLLLSVCLSNDSLWNDAIKLLETCDSACMKSISQFYLGFGLFKEERTTDSISCLMEVLRCTDNRTQRFKARVCNLIGQCFSRMDKSHLSVQMYKEALSSDFSYLLPLYYTSLQYRKLGMDSLELECLNLLVTALEMRNSSPVKDRKEDLFVLIKTEDDDLHYLFSLYSLALRTLQLKRFEVASEKYMQLIDCLKSWKGDIKIHHETIEALYKSEKYTECIQLCDKLISCCHGNTSNNSIILSQTFDQSVLSQSQSYWNDSLTIEQSCTPVSMEISKYDGLIGSQSGRKRKHDEMNQSQTEEEGYITSDVIALRYKAESLYKMGDNTAALSCLERALDSITSSRRKKLHQCMYNISDNVVHEPVKKKQKTNTSISSVKDSVSRPDEQSTHDDVVNILQDSMKSLELERILYEKTAEILTVLKKNKDAQHFVRLAKQIESVEQKT